MARNAKLIKGDRKYSVSRKSIKNALSESSTVTKKTSIKVGRDATTGQFITIKEAMRRPKTTVIETIKHTSKKSTRKK